MVLVGFFVGQTVPLWSIIFTKSINMDKFAKKEAAARQIILNTARKLSDQIKSYQTKFEETAECNGVIALHIGPKEPKTDKDVRMALGVIGDPKKAGGFAHNAAKDSPNMHEYLQIFSNAIVFLEQRAKVESGQAKELPTPSQN